MPRKNSSAVLAPGRAGIWAAIRQLKTFKTKDIVAACASTPDRVRAYLESLTRGGYLSATPGTKLWNPTTYRLVRDCGVHAPALDRDGRAVAVNGRQRMWMAMKALKAFTYKDLSLTAQVSDADARFFIKSLKKAGYLSVTQSATPSSPERVRFLPARDTGPVAPLIRKDKSVVDRNKNRVVSNSESGRAA